jgi:hypothetical protein
MSTHFCPAFVAVSALMVKPLANECLLPTEFAQLLFDVA